MTNDFVQSAQFLQLTERFSFDRTLFANLSSQVKSGLLSPTSNIVSGQVAPIPDGIPSTGVEHRTLGRAALGRGELATLLLSGGMATRFGGVVKALVPVIDDTTFLELKLRDVARVAENAGKEPYSLIMTSFATHDRITEFTSPLAKRLGLSKVRIFPQSMLVRMTPSGQPFLEDGELSPYAPGHGDLARSLLRSQLLNELHSAGVTQLLISNVDNPVATCDADLLGRHLSTGNQMTAEVVRKEAGDRGGVPVLVDGKPQIVEAFRLPPGFRDDVIDVFNTNTIWLSLDVLNHFPELTWCYVLKMVGGRQALQLEQLIGEVSRFVSCGFLTVDRSGDMGRFQPAKDPEELTMRLGTIRQILKARGLAP